MAPEKKILPFRPSPHSPLGLRQRIYELKQQILIDPLTGAYNRQFFETELERVSHSRHPSHLFIFDVDKFKTINDTCGHIQGDNVLKDVVKILKNSFREEDAVCRIGGDEFAVIMTDEKNSSDLDTAEIVNQKLNQIFSEIVLTNDFRIQENLPEFSVSIGHAIHLPYSNCTITKTIEKADSNMYLQKKLKEHR